MPTISRPWEFRRQDETIAVNADQAEFAAILHGSSNLEAGTYDDRVAGAMDDYDVVPPVPTERWGNDDTALDSASSEIGTELKRRREILKAAYPFVLEGSKITYRPSKTSVYEFCLTVSLVRGFTATEMQKLPIAFERLARDAVVIFLGNGTKSYRTGWPADNHEQRPSRFREVIKNLNAMTGEWLWSPEPGLPDNPLPQHTKDEGLDFVVWKDSLDGRAGKLFLLGQCACGDDYLTKFNDIDSDFKKLNQWMRPLSYTTPMRVFATPRHIANDHSFRETNKRAGLTFDRARITLFAEQSVASRRLIANQAKIPYKGLVREIISFLTVGSRN